MTEIQQNRWDQLIRRAANIVGGGSQVNDTLNELFPVLDVEHVPSELLFLSGIKTAICASQLNASALDVNQHQLFNPAGSQVLAVITSIWVYTSVTGFMRMNPASTEITNDIGGARRRDLRTGVASIPVCRNRTLQQVGGIPLTFQARVIANEFIKIDDQNDLFVLFPGTGLTVSTVTINTQSVVNFMWRERVFEPAEINF